MSHVKKDALDWVPIDAERLKRVYDDLVSEAGVTVLFQTFLASVEKEQSDEVSAIIVTNKAGLSAYRAKVYVDCTGDADLATGAGAPFHKGDQNGQMQPGTHCFILSNVDEYAYRHGQELGWWNPNSPIYAITASGKYPEIPDHHICNNIVGPGAVGFNAGHIWDVDNTDPIKMSKALMKGRKMTLAYRDALAEFAPAAFANAFLVSTATVIGARETRRIVGDYSLTLDDYLKRRSFPDEICRNSYFIDIHLTEQENSENGELLMATRVQHYGKGESHGIPYRCLTPRGLKNVIVAGRSISCERIVQGSVRVMPVCLAMGEAAGMAAAHATRLPQINVHAVNVPNLRWRLFEEGAYLPGVESAAMEVPATPAPQSVQLAAIDNV